MDYEDYLRELMDYEDYLSELREHPRTLHCEVEPLKIKSSWDGATATSDDWLDTILYIKGLREVSK